MTIKLAMRIAAMLVTLTLICLTLPGVMAQREGPVIRQPAPGPIIIQPPGPIVRPGPLVLQPMLGPSITFEAKLDPALLERASNLRVLRLAPPKYDEGFLRELVQRTAPGLGGSEQTQVGGMVALSDQSGNFAMVDRESGLLSFSFGMVDQIDDRPGDLPDERRARAIARDFLMQNGLAPANIEQLTMPYVGHIRSASFNPETGQESGPMLQMLTVYFGRMLDDTEVIGNSSKMIVQIGDGGKVVGAGVNWREVAQALPVGARNLRSADQISQDIQTFLRREFVAGQRLVVRQLGLFYYDNGGQYIQPVIGFEVRVQSGEMPPYNYFGQVAVLSNPPEMVGMGPLADEALKALRQGPQDMAPTTAVPGD